MIKKTKKRLDLVAYAKVNLILDVLRRREDNYHEVEMIMQTIDLADQLSFVKINQGIEININHPQVPTDENNLIYQAAKLLFNQFNLKGGIRVDVNKKIPVAAGLAGGSTNAAATLVAINKLWDLGLSLNELVTKGAKLGADVPFCIAGGTQLATGIGTKLEKLSFAPELYLIVVNPPFEVSTAEIYQKLNLKKIQNHPQTAKVISGLREKNSNIIINNLANTLELVTLNVYPQLNNLKLKVGSMTRKALMSGSGPTILGFVKSKEKAEQVKIKLKEELGKGYNILISKTINHGIKEV